MCRSTLKTASILLNSSLEEISKRLHCFRRKFIAYWFARSTNQTRRLDIVYHINISNKQIINNSI